MCHDFAWKKRKHLAAVEYMAAVTLFKNILEADGIYDRKAIIDLFKADVMEEMGKDPRDYI